MPTRFDLVKAHLLEQEALQAALPPNLVTIERIAVGGQGVVYRGEYDGHEAAIKVYFPGQLHKRVDREVDLLGRLNAPSIVRLLWAGDIPFEGYVLPVVVTAFIRGSSLEMVLQGGPLDFDAAAVVAFDVASAIYALWECRVVHRDLKPSNLIIREDRRACVVDLGIARHLEQSPLTTLGATWGTLGYMSPEQTRALRQLTCKSDLYSLGVLLVESLVAEHPSGHDQLRLLGQGLHLELPPPAAAWPQASLLRRLLQPNPASRPKPAEVLSVLRDYAPRA